MPESPPLARTPSRPRDFRGVAGIYAFFLRSDARRVYVGQSMNIGKRYTEHAASIRNTRSTSRFVRALREFGLDAFDFCALEVCSEPELTALEALHADRLGALLPTGLNVRAPSDAMMRGAVASAATRARISAGKKGVKLSASARANMSASHQNVSIETRDKMAASQTGRVHSDETKLKIGVAHTGMKRTDDSRARMSAAAMGRVHAPATIAQWVASKKGRPQSPETIARRMAGLAAGRASRLAAGGATESQGRAKRAAR